MRSGNDVGFGASAKVDSVPASRKFKLLKIVECAAEVPAKLGSRTNLDIN